MKFRTKNFSDDHARVHQDTYPDGSTKLTIIGRRGEACVPTVCLRDSGEFPAEGCVFIGDYGDTEGSLHALQDGGVIGRTNRVLDLAVNTRNPLQRRAVHECELLTCSPDVPE